MSTFVSTISLTEIFLKDVKSKLSFQQVVNLLNYILLFSESLLVSREIEVLRSLVQQCRMFRSGQYWVAVT